MAPNFVIYLILRFLTAKSWTYNVPTLKHSTTSTTNFKSLLTFKHKLTLKWLNRVKDCLFLQWLSNWSRTLVLLLQTSPCITPAPSVQRENNNDRYRSHFIEKTEQKRGWSYCKRRQQRFKDWTNLLRQLQWQRRFRRESVCGIWRF